MSDENPIPPINNSQTEPSNPDPQQAQGEALNVLRQLNVYPGIVGTLSRAMSENIGQMKLPPAPKKPVPPGNRDH